MESSKWKPTEEEREVMEAVWMQVKGACEKLKEETNAKDEHIKKCSKRWLIVIIHKCRLHYIGSVISL